MSTISASTTSTTAYKVTADTTGTLVLQTGATPTTALTLGTDQSATFAGAVNAPNTFGFKNRIINGAMVIDQRNAGSSVTITNTAASTYVLDRWAGYGSQASKFSVQQNAGSVTPPTGFKNYIGATSLSAYTVGASENFTLSQNIEGFNVADLGWGAVGAAAVTLSFWVRSSLTGTFGGSLINSAVDRSYAFSFSVSAANTWEQKTITIAGDTSGTWVTNSGIGIRVSFGLGVGSTLSTAAGSWNAGFYISATGATSVVGTNGATFYITGVQLEKGSTATSFDYRPYGTELALCQRYAVMISSATSNGYFNRYGTGINTANNATNIMVSLPCPMRIVPSLTTTSVAGFAVYYAGNSYACNAVTIGGDGNTISSFAQINGNIATASLVNGGASMLMSNSNITSSLLFSAEL